MKKINDISDYKIMSISISSLIILFTLIYFRYKPLELFNISISDLNNTILTTYSIITIITSCLLTLLFIISFWKKNDKDLKIRFKQIGIGIGAMVLYFLLPYLEEFHSLYPKIDIQIITNLTSDLMPKLKNGLIDIVILNLNDKNYGNDIDIIKCRKINDCFVVNNKYKDLTLKEVSIKELNNYPLILQAKGSNTREFLDNIARENGVVLKPNIELASYSLVVEFSKIGLGIGYATKEYIKEAIKNKELYELKIKEKIPSRYIGIALSKNHIPNFSTKKLIEIITK